MKKGIKKEVLLELFLVAIAASLMIEWAFTTNKIGGPDEPMRYQVAQYLYEHPGELPRGDEETLLDPIWGLSYAFFPVLSYMVSAVFMWITSVFADSADALLHAARMADVLFVTIASWMTLRIGKHLFEDERRWLFGCMVIFLPGYLFMGTYVNCDSLALMASAMILLAWARYLKQGWTWKNCILLACGMGICFLSYYNAYGWILWSFVFFCATILGCSKEPMKVRIQFLFKRGLPIAGITLAICGWWFIRNFLLYDGDILGRNASNLCAELHAMEEYKPSVHQTPQKMGWSLLSMFLCQPEGWPHNWFLMVFSSFIGTFGMFNIFMSETVNNLYLLFMLVGMAGMLFLLHELDFRKKTVTIQRLPIQGTEEKYRIIKTVSVYREWSKKGVFHLCMAAGMITPFLLLINYAYCSDFQAQGRYMISGIIPVMYFVTLGYGELLKRFIKKENIYKWFYRASCVLWIIGAWYNYLTVIVPAY